MIRAILLIICVMLWTSITIVPMVSGNNPNEWDNFEKQYTQLLEDNKKSLAQKMLDKRLPLMEQYAKRLPEKQFQQWKTLLLPVKNGQANQMQLSQFFTYMDYIYANDSTAWLKEEISQLRRQAGDVQVSSQQLQSNWKVIEPVLISFIPQEGLTEVSAAVSHITSNDAFYAREFLLQELDKLQLPSATAKDAILLTALIIGGAIIITLIYVAYRKFKASKETLHKSENS